MRRRPDALAGPSPTFALMGETVTAGFLVAVASLGVVTALPAMALAARHLRAHLDGEPTGLMTSVREFGPTAKALGVVGTLAPAALVLLSLNLLIAEHTQLPGQGLVTTVSYLAMFLVVVVALRVVGSPAALEQPWREQLRTAVLRTKDDPVGTALLLGAAVMTVAILLMFPPLIIVVGGLLALAALAVDSRRAGEARA